MDWTVFAIATAANVLGFVFNLILYFANRKIES